MSVQEPKSLINFIEKMGEMLKKIFKVMNSNKILTDNVHLNINCKLYKFRILNDILMRYVKKIELYPVKIMSII